MSLQPLDFSTFLDAHRKSDRTRALKAAKAKRDKNRPPKNKFGNVIPKSARKKDNGNSRDVAVGGKVGDRSDGEMPPSLDHGANSKWILNRYANKSTPEGKALMAIMKAIEKDIGRPFDARQSLLMSLIRSKVIIVMQIGKYLECQEEVIDYDKGSVAHVVDKTFFTASNSLRQALTELYTGKNNKQRGEKTYDEIVAEMNRKQ